MTLGLQENRHKRRRQRRWSVLKWLLILSMLIAAGVFAHETGSQLARIDVTRLEQRVAELDAEAQATEQEKSNLRAQLAETRHELETWQERYSREVPTGDMADLLEVAAARLDNGVPADRLSFVIANASEERACTEGPTTRRFIVQTPLAGGAADAVSFANNSIIVTAQGPSATDDQGRTEAWFDPDEPIVVSFSRPGGESSRAEGTLPLHHSVVENDKEHRFSVVSGNRAFVEVTWELCDYP